MSAAKEALARMRAARRQLSDDQLQRVASDAFSYTRVLINGSQLAPKKNHVCSVLEAFCSNPLSGSANPGQLWNCCLGNRQTAKRDFPRRNRRVLRGAVQSSGPHQMVASFVTEGCCLVQGSLKDHPALYALVIDGTAALRALQSTCGRYTGRNPKRSFRRWAGPGCGASILRLFPWRCLPGFEW